MYKVGEVVKWMCPLDEDYSYGRIEHIKKSIATVRCTGYYTGVTAEVHLKYIEKARIGGHRSGRRCKKFNKRSTFKS